MRDLNKFKGFVDDIKMVKGLIFDKKVSHTVGGTNRVENAKVAFI